MINVRRPEIISLPPENQEQRAASRCIERGNVFFFMAMCFISNFMT